MYLPSGVSDWEVIAFFIVSSIFGLAVAILITVVILKKLEDE